MEMKRLLFGISFVVTVFFTVVFVLAALAMEGIPLLGSGAMLCASSIGMYVALED